MTTKFDPDDYLKVGIRLNGPMHLMTGDNYYKTLCGLRWWYDNVLGDSYCQKCQHIYALRKKAAEKD